MKQETIHILKNNKPLCNCNAKDPTLMKISDFRTIPPSSFEVVKACMNCINSLSTKDNSELFSILCERHYPILLAKHNISTLLQALWP
jgi:hypothetical protein